MVVGTLSTTDEDGNFIYVNEGNKVKLEIKFTLEPALLSMLQKNVATRRLVLQTMIKSATEATITFKVNGTELMNGEETQTVISDEGDQLHYELPSGLGAENIVTLETISPATNLGLLFISLEIADADRSIAH